MDLRPLLLIALLLSASLGAGAQSANDTTSGRRVDFPLAPFRDTLFTALEAAFRVRMDDDGQIWYSSEGGLVHVDPVNVTRKVYTKFDGLPSSYTLGLDVEGPRVYVGTDLGLAVVERATGAVETVSPANSPLPDVIVTDVARIGDEVWIGTRDYGLAIWNATRSASEPTAWTLKNTSTTATYARPIRRIVETPTAVWLGTEGDGAWRFDRASRTWNVTLRVDGLLDDRVLGVAERKGEVWFATATGLSVRRANGTFDAYTAQQGLPHYRVLDVDVILTADGTTDVFASTAKGLWQLNPETGSNLTRAQTWTPGTGERGVLGAYLYDSEPTTRGWLFATQRGVSYYLGNGVWRYYATGPSSGPSWGPLSFGYTAAGVGERQGHLWFGTSRGLAAYRLPTGGNPGFWQNFGEWQNYPAAPQTVNWIDSEGGVTWFATNGGVYGFRHENGTWISRPAQNSRNLVYGLDAVGDELWVGLFGEGLLMENLTTGITRSWTLRSLVNPIPDPYITDVQVTGNDVWVAASLGVIRIDRATGVVRATYTTAEGLPGSGYAFRVLPDGPVVWVGTKTGGVAKLDVASGHVSRVWNATQTAGFPVEEVRSLHREGSRLWVGTKDGLARIDVSTGGARAWNQTDSALVQDYVNGITSAGGLLYLATLSGIQRMEIATETFLPMQDGPGVVHAEEDDATALPGRVSVRIHSPRDGEGVTGVTQVRGSAVILGAAVDRVEASVGDGAWQAAEGNESWSYEWNTSGLPPNEPVRLRARAFSGNLTGETEIVVTPVAASRVPLVIEEVPLPEAYAQRALRVAARVEGDEPLTASFFYRAPGSRDFARLPLVRQGGFFLGTVPAGEMREGEMSYYFEAQSGLLLRTAAGDAASPSTLLVAPTPRLSVALAAPPLVEARAGSETSFTLHITNVGTQPATFSLAAAGLRAAWVHVPPDDIDLAPGASREIVARLSVPPAAFADNTTLTFEVRDRDGRAEPATASVPLRIQAAPVPSSPPPSPAPGSVIPAPAWLALAALALALAARRRSQ